MKKYDYVLPDPGGPAPPPTPPPASNATSGAPPPPPPAPPDYKSLINGDPLYQQLMADLAAQGIQDAATRKASTDRALIQFGEIPNLTSAINGLGLNPNSAMYNMLFGDVDKATVRGAQDLTNAGLSTVAQMGRQHATNLDSLMSSLAARGSIRSGATGVGTGLENKAYTQNQFTARSGLLDYLSGVQQAFTQSERDRQAQLRQGAMDATNRQISLHPYDPTPPPVPNGAYGTGTLTPVLPAPSDPADWGPSGNNYAGYGGRTVPV